MNANLADLLSPAATNPDVFGSKAATLARLAVSGVDVPGGVAIAAAEYLAAFDRANVPNRDSYRDFAEWATVVRSELESAIAPTELLADLRSALGRLSHNGPWIVRSSAVGEDGETSSFAGQLESISDVATENLGAAVTQVWASAWSPRAAMYRSHRGLTDVTDLPVGVLVQPFIEPEYAGVAFTRSPLPNEDGMLVEAVQGRGETLVGGAAVPARYVFDEFGQALPDRSQLPLAVPAPLLRRIWEIGQRLEADLGSPQDIEWLAVDGNLRIVQARPITTKVHADQSDPDDFQVAVCVIDLTSRDLIPDDLAAKDKFRLRLLASAADVPVGRGWMLSVSPRTGLGSGPGAAETISKAAAQIAKQVERFPQVSMVLQNPGRLNGEIVRQFTDLDNIEANLRKVVGRIGAQHQQFQLIATEILQAHMSGISHLVDGKLVVEVAFGSYVPKGVVPTSLYVVEVDGAVTQHVPVVQDRGVFIEGGAPHDREVGQTAELSRDQLTAIRAMTQAVSDEYPDVSVEFGVLQDGLPYLIDIIPDMSPVSVSDVRVMSPGAIEGVTQISTSDDLAAESLDAHFHSERGSSNSAAAGVNTIVVAPRPFLALENHLAESGAGSVGFIFEQGSLLGHLAIILREHKVPAIVVDGVCGTLQNGVIVEIDTSSENLYKVVDDELELERDGVGSTVA